MERTGGEVEWMLGVGQDEQGAGEDKWSLTERWEKERMVGVREEGGNCRGLWGLRGWWKLERMVGIGENGGCW